MRIVVSDHHPLPLPEGHRFPVRKYGLLRERVAALALGTLVPARAATEEELARAHAPDWIRRVVEGRLAGPEVRRIGLPWSPQLVERSLRSVGATLDACVAAFQDGVGVQLGGGTHHASAAEGSGYCVFNDVAVAARAAQAEGRAGRVLVVDLDVHQGDGTAAIFRDDSTVFTFSMHGEKNFPFRKVEGDLDVPLPDGTGDDAYLRALARHLPEAMERAVPGLVLYLAGADPWRGDRLGRLALSRAGLAARDGMVLEACVQARVPVAVTMAGGYADPIEDTVEIQAATVAVAGLAWSVAARYTK